MYEVEYYYISFNPNGSGVGNITMTFSQHGDVQLHFTNPSAFNSFVSMLHGPAVCKWNVAANELVTSNDPNLNFQYPS